MPSWVKIVEIKFASEASEASCTCLVKGILDAGNLVEPSLAAFLLAIVEESHVLVAASWGKENIMGKADSSYPSVVRALCLDCLVFLRDAY